MTNCAQKIPEQKKRMETKILNEFILYLQMNDWPKIIATVQFTSKLSYLMF